MERYSFGVAVIAMGLLGGPAPAASGPVLPASRVLVRIYDGGGATEASWPAGLPTAAAILAGAGVDVEWLRCDARHEPAACATPIEDGGFAVRLVARSPHPPNAARLPLGYALIDSRTRSGRLATVFVDRVLWLARAASGDAGALLGRAVAHEIGHLLLGGNEHSRGGLMRAVWGLDDLRREHDADWRFTSRQAAALRAALRAPTLVARSGARGTR